MQTVIGWLVSLVLVVLVSQSVSSRRLDCTKFVFAPRCRGVAAKRGLTSDLSLFPAAANGRAERKRTEAAPAYVSNNDDGYGWLSLALSQPAGSLAEPTRKQKLRQLALRLLQLDAGTPQSERDWPATSEDEEYRED